MPFVTVGSGIRCPGCGTYMRVIDTRSVDAGRRVRRRRECPECYYRVSTDETIDVHSYTRFPPGFLLEMEEALDRVLV